MLLIVLGIITSSLACTVWSTPLKRDVELFGLKFKNPANMQTQLGINTGSGSVSSSGNPANFAATLTGPGTQNSNTSGSTTGGIQNPANFAATLTGSGGQSQAGQATSAGQNPHQQVPGDMTAALEQYHSQYGNQAGTVQHQLHEKPVLGSGGLSATNAQNQLPGTCPNTNVATTCPMACQSLDSVTGCIVCSSGCQSGTSSPNGGLQSTSAPNTSSGGPLVTSSTNAVTTAAPVQQSGVCPAFPTNCPRGGVAIQNGCPVCTALQTTTIRTTIAQVTKAVTTTPIVTTTPLPRTCAPIRCLAPCNKGIKFDANQCPVCVC